MSNREKPIEMFEINPLKCLFLLRYVQRKWQKVLETMMVAMYTAAFAYIIIFYKNDCKPIENDAETTLVQVDSHLFATHLDIKSEVLSLFACLSFCFHLVSVFLSRWSVQFYR